jgi:hypothetical protein
MNFLTKRIGLIWFGILSTIEGLLNTVIYLLFLERVIKPLDLSLPFYFNYFKVRFEPEHDD